MNVRIQNSAVYHDGQFVVEDALLSILSDFHGDSVSFERIYLLPGLVDVHVHLREPGFLYKESIATGTRAAARGGYSDVCTMPNLNPVPDSPEHLEPQLQAIQRDAVIRVHPYGSVTVGQQGKTLSQLSELAPQVVAFSDDGRGIQSESIMRQAMAQCQRLGKILAAHCEDNSLLRGGYIHDGDYAKAHGHPLPWVFRSWGSS